MIQTKLSHVCVSVVLTVLAGLTNMAQAQISVGPSGSSGTLTFDTQPAATEFATYVLTGSGSTYIDPAAMDAGAQTVDASIVVNQLPAVAQATPGTFAGGMRWNSTGLYLQSRPTTSGTNAAGVMKATLQNDSGGDLTEITVSYDFALFNDVDEEVPGFRVFWSLTGTPDSWTLLSTLSGNETPGTHTESLGTAVWPAGSVLYLLWADDNDDGLSDQGQTIDNFVVNGISTVITPLTITSHPQSTNVAERGTATFSVVASGSPQTFYWFRDGALIPGAGQSSYTIPSALYPTDNGAQFFVIVSNSLGAVTSSTATLTVLPDTNAPTVVSAVGDITNTIVTVTFSEAVDPLTISEGTATVFITGTNPDDGLLTTGFVMANSTTIIFTTDPREPGSNYSVRVTGVLDVSSQQNPLAPEPTFLPLRTTIQLIGFDTDNEWKYDINNGDRFGTGWETVGYDDSAWPSGPAPLGLDVTAGTPPQPAINTPLPYGATSAPTYFRRHFLLPTGTNGITLTLRHVIEDAAVYFINGQEAGRFRVGGGALTFDTRATVNAPDPTPIEGPFSLPTTNLLPGDNVIAVVLIQAGATSSDIEFAAELTTTVTNFSSGPPVITTQPQSQTVNERQSVTFSVVADGTQPISYQWRTNGVDIPGATGSSYTINSATPNNNGTYSVFLSNSAGNATSADATLTVNPDLTGPTFISAVGNTNLTDILLTFSEPLNSANAQNIANYSVQLTAGGGALTIGSATLVNGTNVLLTTSPREQSQNYTITLSGITDTALAQNPATPSSRPVLGGIVILAPDGSHVWRFNQTSNDLTTTGWQNVGFDDSSWESGVAGISSVGEEASAGFELRTFTLQTGSNIPPTIYFRTHFNFPGSTAGANLQWAGVVDDGAVFYINGVEAGRIRITNSPVYFTNLANAGGPEITNVFHQAEGPFALNAGSLVAGDNVLAVELHQNAFTSSDAVLSIQLIAEIQSFADVGPRLRISLNPANGAVTVSWSGPGILQQTSELLPSGTVWTDVPGNPNPHTVTPAADEKRFFTLRQ